MADLRERALYGGWGAPYAPAVARKGVSGLAFHGETQRVWGLRPRDEGLPTNYIAHTCTCMGTYVEPAILSSCNRRVRCLPHLCRTGRKYAPARHNYGQHGTSTVKVWLSVRAYVRLCGASDAVEPGMGLCLHELNARLCLHARTLVCTSVSRDRSASV